MPVFTSKDFEGKDIKQVVETRPAIDSEPEKEKEVRLYELQHPDWTAGNDITCTVKLDSGQEIKIDHGRVSTRFESIYQELLRRGYIPCKNYEEAKIE